MAVATRRTRVRRSYLSTATNPNSSSSSSSKTEAETSSRPRLLRGMAAARHPPARQLAGRWPR
eukprot:360538-Chlamydomonas_euryale.AAC.1